MAYHLSDSDNKEISEAINCVKLQKESVDESITNFEAKGLFALWWDAKGFWNTSDKETVLESMEVYRELSNDILRCIELAANDDENAYAQLTYSYKKIEKFKIDAKIDSEGRSKALCSLAKTFLDNHYFKLNHSLKRVENHILKKGIRETTETVAKLKENVTKASRNLDTYAEENRNLRYEVKCLEEKNQDFEVQLEKLSKDNKDLLNSVTETNEAGNRKISEMLEQNKRDMQEMIKEFQDMTGSK